MMSLRSSTEEIQQVRGAKSIRRIPTSKQEVSEAAVKANRELDAERVVELSSRAVQLKRIRTRERLYATSEP
jgi:hypothetical protein